MGTKKCPFCAEEIQAEAIKCKFCSTSLDSKTLKQIKQKRPKKRVPGWLVFLAIFGIIIWCVFLWSNEEESNSLSQARRTKQSQPNKTTPQDGTVEKLKYEVKKVLGSSNRGVAKVYKIQDTSKNIKIIFTIDDNLTGGMIKTSAKTDIMDILKAIQSSRYDYSEVVIFGTFPLTDKYGNSEESTVLKVSYTPATVNKINWQNFLYDNVYDIADSVWLHPAFR